MKLSKQGWKKYKNTKHMNNTKNNKKNHAEEENMINES